ncbi:hypothetical protein Taro_052088 [Colocasia esculenta]|uniref:Uncharacterized protein n=1 Tax=Colocasia esculenta TaxID=4460 RepID=A0A843XHI9_COLES|nr:hypothetical protein [Colocasia esculenta]
MVSVMSGGVPGSRAVSCVPALADGLRGRDSLLQEFIVGWWWWRFVALRIASSVFHAPLLLWCGLPWEDYTGASLG